MIEIIEFLTYMGGFILLLSFFLFIWVKVYIENFLINLILLKEIISPSNYLHDYNVSYHDDGLYLIDRSIIREHEEY